jgi:hypothetical protein
MPCRSTPPDVAVVFIKRHASSPSMPRARLALASSEPMLYHALIMPAAERDARLSRHAATPN